jgi:hypothetical protein
MEETTERFRPRKPTWIQGNVQQVVRLDILWMLEMDREERRTADWSVSGSHFSPRDLRSLNTSEM